MARLFDAQYLNYRVPVGLLLEEPPGLFLLFKNSVQVRGPVPLRGPGPPRPRLRTPRPSTSCWAPVPIHTKPCALASRGRGGPLCFAECCQWAIPRSCDACGYSTYFKTQGGCCSDGRDCYMTATDRLHIIMCSTRRWTWFCTDLHYAMLLFNNTWLNPGAAHTCTISVEDSF